MVAKVNAGNLVFQEQETCIFFQGGGEIQSGLGLTARAL